MWCFLIFLGFNSCRCTICFWEAFHKMYPDSPYEYVTSCYTCRRFDLYETEAEMKADDPKWW
ncbi:hypothetical protein GCD07_23455 [Shigella sonnei]|nr:hypothetical protein [Shigella sonnei]